MSLDAGHALQVSTEAVQLLVEKRTAFPDRACAGDEELRRKVEHYSDATIERETLWNSGSLRQRLA